jgi:hypothetical protein
MQHSLRSIIRELISSQWLSPFVQSQRKIESFLNLYGYPLDSTADPTKDGYRDLKQGTCIGQVNVAVVTEKRVGLGSARTLTYKTILSGFGFDVFGNTVTGWCKSSLSLPNTTSVDIKLPSEIQ